MYMVGGIAGVIFAWRVGPRLGRFGGKKEKDKLIYRFEPHSYYLIGLGTIILWFGWYGFNAGSTMQLSQGNSKVAARIFATTSLSPSAAILTTFFERLIRSNRCPDPARMCNSAIAGLVAITACCADVEAWAAVLIGAIAGWVYLFAEQFLERIRVDDPLGAFAVHGACGCWGTLAVGLFGADWSDHPASLKQFASQCVGIVTISAWTSAMSLFCLFTYERLAPLRVPPDQELKGLDEFMFTNLNPTGPDFSSAPEGRVAIVITDVQSSTKLWAVDELMMSSATALHDHVIRTEIANHNGYEITTEGDAFQIAFPSSDSAVRFCIAVQSSLVAAKWSETLAQHVDAAIECKGPDKVRAGLRVRMGIDVGWCDRRLHSTTRTFRYKGSAHTVVKAMVDALPGGGVTAISHRVLADIAPQIKALGRISICDLGTHILSDKLTSPVGLSSVTEKLFANNVMSMGPLGTLKQTGPGFKEAPGVTSDHTMGGGFAQRSDDRLSVAEGSSPASATEVESIGSAFFGEEQKTDTKVVICFASILAPKENTPVTVESKTPSARISRRFSFQPQQTPDSNKTADDNSSSAPNDPSIPCLTDSISNSRRSSTAMTPSSIMSKATKDSALSEKVLRDATRLIRSTLGRFSGYECQEDQGVFMLAFKTSSCAVLWGSFIGGLVTSRLKGQCVLAAGMHVDTPTEIRPHDTTGRADYFGTVVNASARVHSQARKAVGFGLSQVFLTRAVRADADAQLRGSEFISASQGLEYTSFGTATLKGFKDPVELFNVQYCGADDEDLHSRRDSRTSIDSARLSFGYGESSDGEDDNSRNNGGGEIDAHSDSRMSLRTGIPRLLREVAQKIEQIKDVSSLPV